jgi:hypothetical protein
MTTMNTAKALAIVCDMASRYGENYEEGFSRRITADDSDEACQAVVDQCAGEYDLDDVLEIRDLWRAINTLQMVQAQEGCEHFDKAVTDGKLTSLVDVVVFG